MKYSEEELNSMTTETERKNMEYWMLEHFVLGNVEHDKNNNIEQFKSDRNHKLNSIGWFKDKYTETQLNQLLSKYYDLIIADKENGTLGKKLSLDKEYKGKTTLFLGNEYFESANVIINEFEVCGDNTIQINVSFDNELNCSFPVKLSDIGLEIARSNT